ncbi:IS5 family transposase [Vibrio cholerae]|nr:IS5 family transposase [Vibrio cholerae]
MPRLMLTDKRSQKLLQVMKNTGRIYNKSEHRMTFEGSLYRLRTGIPWRDLPTKFGDWNTVYRRFNLWPKKGLLEILFKELSKPSDYDWGFADSSIVKAHQHSSGAAIPDNRCIGKSRGGNSTKIQLVVDSGGLPIYFELSEGQRNDIARTESLVDHLKEVKVFIADKGYDSDALRAYVDSKGGEAIIPKRNYGKDIDKESMNGVSHKYRHLVENAFARIKHFQAISMRYDKLTRNYASMVSLAFTIMWLPMYC